MIIAWFGSFQGIIKRNYVELNKSKNNNLTEWDEKTIELIKKYSKYDKLLWEHAKNKFAWKRTKYGQRLISDEIEFERENKRNYILRSIFYQLKDKLFR